MPIINNPAFCYNTPPVLRRGRRRRRRRGAVQVGHDALRPRTPAYVMPMLCALALVPVLLTRGDLEAFIRIIHARHLRLEKTIKGIIRHNI